MDFNPSQNKVFESFKNFCVVAGAGSGKTGTLVEYIARFMEEGLQNGEGPVSVTSLLALTFSEKAATEMRARLAQSFRQRQREAFKQDDIPAVSFWERELRRIGQAEIGTIHSYALSLVKNYSHLLGLSVNMLVDEGDGLTSDLDEVFLDLLNENNQDFLDLLKVLPFRSQGACLASWLGTAATRLSGWGLDCLSADLSEPVLPNPKIIVNLKEVVNQAIAYAEGGGLKLDKQAYILEVLIKFRDSLSNPENCLVENWLESISDWNIYAGALSSWHVSAKQIYKTAITELLKPLSLWQSAVYALPVKKNLLNLVNQIPQRIRSRRMLRNSVSFDDILYLARGLLRDRPEVRREESRKWQLVVIDEFQDTNRLQADLLAQLLIAQEDESRTFVTLPWAELAPKLRVFGDPKQSIYRFRGSEPIIMNDLAEKLSIHGDVLTLDHNYRTQKKLIDFFNAFFPDYLFEPYAPQIAARPDLYDGPSVVWLTNDNDYDKNAGLGSIEEVRAKLTVNYLERLFSGEAGVYISDKDNPDEKRLPSFGDVTILLRKKKNASLFETAILQAGWPCHTLKGQDLLDAPETRGLVAAYLFLAGRDPSYNLATVLTSPLGPVSEMTLTRLCWPLAPDYSQRRDLAYYFTEDLPDFPDIINSEEKLILGELRELLLTLKPFVFRRPPGEIMESLVEERRLLPLVMGGESGSPEKVKNVQHFLSLVKNLPFHDPHHPESTADYLEDLWSRGHELGEGEEEGEDNQKDESILGGETKAEPVPGSINIMTIHRSKGLEFPVVVIPEADYADMGSRASLMISDDGRLAVSFKKDESLVVNPSDFTIMKEDEKNFSQAEYRRLFYVAATRARDHLVLAGINPKTSTNYSWLFALTQWADWEKFVRKETPDISELKVGQQPQKREISQKDKQDDEPPLLAVPPKSEGLYTTVTDYCRHLAKIKSPSELLGVQSDSLDDFLDDSAPVGPAGPTSPRLRGILFHALMEKTSYTESQKELLSLLEKEARRLSLTPSPKELDFLVEKLVLFQKSRFGQELVESLAKNLLVWREWPFWLRLDKDEYGHSPVMLRGEVDLFYVRSDGVGQIVDYKLAQEGHRDVYERQIGLYALALKKAGFTSEIKTDLWFAGA